MTLRTWAAVAIPVAIFLAHASILGAWIVDDAGISFAYARSLATGHGLVAQAGAPPVEGFTNLLWVVLLSGAMRLGLFDPVWAPKALAALCVALSFLLTVRLLNGSGKRPAWIAGAAASMTAGITGFAVWSISGLENALYAALLQALAVVLSADASHPEAREKLAVRSAALLFLVVCTRPDGALYFWLPPFVLGWGAASAGEPAAGERWRRRPWVLYVTWFAGLWALLTVFRAAYFQDVLPNTFYAKKGEGAWLFAGLLSRLSPLAAAAVVVVLGAGAMLAVGWGCHAAGRGLGRARSPSLFARHASIPFLLTAMVVYVALPGDWMGEYRFATPVFLFGPAALLGLLHDLASRSGTPRAALPVAVAALLAATAFHARSHTAAFASRPTISLDGVRELSRRIATELAPLGRRASVLTPDIGGALWEDRFQVIDYVGLIDQRLGRVVGRDPRLLRDHILDVRRPDGIWLHSNWLRELALDHDERFTRDYAPAWEQRPEGGGSPVAGFYVRRGTGLTGR